MRHALLFALALAVGGGRADAQTRAVVDPQAPAASLGALSSRVKPLDRVYVYVTRLEVIEGRFSHASETSITLDVNGRAQEIPAASVWQVRRRGGNRAKQGLLFGFLAGAAVATIATTTSDSESDYSAGDKIAFSVLAGGGTGAVWGAIVGVFVHKRPVVYQAPFPTVRILPVLAPGRAGLTLSARF